MTLHVHQEPTTDIWVFDTASTIYVSDFMEKLTGICLNHMIHMNMERLKILVDLRMVSLMLDFDITINQIIDKMLLDLPGDIEIRVAFVNPGDLANTAQKIFIDQTEYPILCVKNFTFRTEAAVWLGE